jgi:hypothetical protein
LSHLYIKTLFLPRQARDKDRENSQKDHFRSGDGVDNSLLFTAAAPSKRTEMVLEAHPPGLEHEGHGSALRVGKKTTSRAHSTNSRASMGWVRRFDLPRQTQDCNKLHWRLTAINIWFRKLQASTSYY